MNQCGGRKSVARWRLGHPLASYQTQFFVDQRKELCGGVFIAVRGLNENLRHIL